MAGGAVAPPLGRDRRSSRPERSDTGSVTCQRACGHVATRLSVTSAPATRTLQPAAGTTRQRNVNRPSPHLPECCRPPATLISRQRGALRVNEALNRVIRTRRTKPSPPERTGTPRISDEILRLPSRFPLMLPCCESCCLRGRRLAAHKFGGRGGSSFGWSRCSHDDR